MMFDDNDTPVLSREWHLRPDHGGGVVYRFSTDESKFVRLTGYETVAVSLFDGSMCLVEIADLLSQMLAQSRQEAQQCISKLLEKNEVNGFLIPLSEAGHGFTHVNAPRILRELSGYKPKPSRALRLQAPLSLLLIPSYACQTDCIYCYAERPHLPRKSHMSPLRWVEVLTEAGELGVDLLTFSGGDPLTYPALDQLLAVASRYQMSFMLPTKTRVTRRRAEQLAELALPHGQIQVSVDSFDAITAEQMTRTKNYAERARATIVNLRAAGMPVRTNTVVTPLNLSGVEALVRNLRELGVNRAHVTNYYRTYYRHDDALFLDKAQIEYLHSIVSRLRNELDWPGLNCNAATLDYSRSGGNREERWKNRVNCSGGFSSCTIQPNGDVTLCEQAPHDNRFVVGNVAKQSLLEVWNSQELIDFIVPEREVFAEAPCATCEEFDTCHRHHGRCFRDAFFSYGSIYAPSPNCPRARPGLRMA